MHHTPFVDLEMSDLRRRQAELLMILPEDVRESLLPAIESELGPPPDRCALVERALRERVESVIAGNELLRAYLDRVRRHCFASAVIATIDERYRELAGDAPPAMDDQLSEAKGELDPSVTYPAYEEQMAVARIVPLIGWADFLQARAGRVDSAT